MNVHALLARSASRGYERENERFDRIRQPRRFVPKKWRNTRARWRHAFNVHQRKYGLRPWPLISPRFRKGWA